MCAGVSGALAVPRGAGGPGGAVGRARGSPAHAPSPQRCLRRILQGLQHYRDLLSSDIFTARPLPRLETALDRLLGLVQVGSGGWQPGGAMLPAARAAGAHHPGLGPLTPLSPQQEHGRPPQHPVAPSEAWAHPLLQRLALQRLQSFAAIMSRVFTHSASPR